MLFRRDGPLGLIRHTSDCYSIKKTMAGRGVNRDADVAVPTCGAGVKTRSTASGVRHRLQSRVDYIGCLLFWQPDACATQRSQCVFSVQAVPVTMAAELTKRNHRHLLRWYSRHWMRWFCLSLPQRQRWSRRRRLCRHRQTAPLRRLTG